MPNRLYFINNTANTAVAYDFDGTAQSSDNISLGSGTWRGGVATTDRIFFINGSTAVAYDFDGTAQSSDNISLGSGTWTGAVATTDRIFFIDNNNNAARAYDFSGNRQATDDISLGSGTWAGGVATDNRLHFINPTTNATRAYDFSGSRQATDDISLSDGSWQGGVTSDNRIYFVNDTSNTAVAYDFSGTAQSGDNIALGSGTWLGGTSIFESSATITLSTTDTDIRAGDTVTIDIDSSIDITLTDANITVTGGTRGTLTGSGQDYALSVTAGAAGTLTVSIAEDAVPEGNAAVSEDFTITANYQLHIADGSNDNISVIGYDTADGDTADALRTYTTTDSTDVQSIVYDGTHIHVTNWQQSTVRVYAINLSGVSPVVRSYTVTGISQPSGMAFDGTHLHIADRASDNIRVIAPDTADNGTATVLRTYEVTGLGDCRGMAFDGENIHAADYTDDNIRVFAPDTPNNGTATVIRTYTVRDVNHSRSIAFDGVNIHVSDVTDDNFRVVAVPTSGGAQTVLRTYTVTDIGNPRGMTGIPVTTTTQANLTITTTHGDIYAGQSVIFQIASDIDITDFTLSDVGLTGATAVGLSTFGERMWQLQTTADDGAGDIVISIAENVVSPGNIAVSETFTRNARITPTITFANTNLVPNQQTLATITSPQAVTGMTRGDLTLDVGTLGATLTRVSATVYRIPVTAPSSGSGSMTLTLAEDAVTPPNTAVSASVDYTETLVATALEVVSGDGQSAQVGNALANPLVVQVNDQNGDVFAGATVSFTTTGGTLSTASATTGANGQASTSLTLPNTAGEYTVTASVTGLTDVIFTATASAVPLVATTLEIVSGDSQSGVVSTALANDLVVRVLDQNNNAFSGSTVTFSTTGGTLSETSVVTGADGQASTSLTLPAAEGDYTVTAAVSGLSDVTFSATATAALTVAGEPQNAEVDPSATTAVATWEAPLDDGGDAVTGYRLTLGMNTPIDVGDVLTYTLTELSPETDYSLAIAAINGQGVGTPATVMFTTQAVVQTAPTTSTEPTYNADMGYNVLPEALGALKRINSSGTVESLGNWWHEQRPFNVAGTRCLSFDGDLHVSMGAGNPDELLRYNSVASKADNFPHLALTDQLRYIVPTFDANGNRYALLADLAKRVNATLSFENGLICVRDRSPYRAEADGATGTGTGNLDFDNANKTFPTSGYLKINSEIVQYTGVSGSAFTGVVRGVLGTTVVSHVDDTGILYLDAVIAPSRLSGTPSLSTDTTRIYNVIESGDDALRVKDDASIRRYNGERPYPLDLGLTQHENAWRQSVFENYLEALKDAQSLVTLELDPSFYLMLGETIGVQYGDWCMRCRLFKWFTTLNLLGFRGGR